MVSRIMIIIKYYYSTSIWIVYIICSNDFAKRRKQRGRARSIRDASDANDGVGGGHISKLAATRRAGRRGRAHRETKVHFAAGPGVGQDPPLGSKRARRRGRSGAALLQDQSGPDQVGANASAHEGRGKGK